MKIIRFTILVVFVNILIFCTKENNGSNISTPEDLLIRDNEISGWESTGNKWVANSSGDLNNVINGAAVVYTLRGFVEAAMQEYSGNLLDRQELINLYIYDQGTTENAKSVYDELVNQMSSPLDWTDGAGEEAKIDRISSLSQRILFYDSKYFVSLSITNGIDEALDVLKAFSVNIDTKIK